MNVVYEPKALAVIKDCDVAVLEGSFSGISAALTCAAVGKRVVVIEPRTTLGREMTAYLRPWMKPRACEGNPGLPPIIRAVLTPDCSMAMGDETIFHLDRVKIALEDSLLQAGVQILYASQVSDLLVEGDGLRGVVTGNKSGRQVIRCDTLLDCSPAALAVKLGDPLAEKVVQDAGPLWRTIELSEVDLAQVGDLALPDFLGVDGGRFNLHRGFFNDRHWLVEFPIERIVVGGDPNSRTAEVALQEITVRTAAYLLGEVSGFAGAYLAGSSYESQPMWRYVPHDSSQQDRNYSAPPAGDLASAVDSLRHGVYVIDAAGIAAQPPAGIWNSAYEAALCGVRREHWRQVRLTVEGQAGSTAPAQAQDDFPPTTVKVHETDSFAHSAYAEAQVAGKTLPISEQVDVLVVGGGTSGATAAIIVGEYGLRTLLLEMNPRLGGTGTIGGVHSYWFGREAGFNLRTRKAVENLHRRLGQPLPTGGIPRWNIEARAYALLALARERGVQVEFNSRAIGAVMDGNIVRGVVTAGPDGLRVVEARVVIDATGDGDIAAFAGAQTAYGAPRNRATMWYSLAQFAAPGKTQNNFTSMVDVTNVEDTTRAVLAGRRRGQACIEHGSYIATRESRRVMGEVELTLTDQLRQKQYPDTINIAFSNHDIKGHTDSDWVRTGLIPPHLEIEIPFGAILPKGLEQILVVGKAISATHDALPAIRMQRDLENLGGAAATAAALSIRHGTPVRAAPIRAVQTDLVNAGVLPAEILKREIQPVVYSVAQIEGLLAQIDADQPLYAYSDMDMDQVYRGVIPLVEVCCAGEVALPAVRQALQRAGGRRRLYLAQMLALMGDPAGVEDLIDAIWQELEGGRLPERSAHIRNTQLPPDQGAAPQVVYGLYSLGMLRDERAIGVWERVAEMLGQTTQEDFYSHTKSTFTYIDAICFGAERLGSERCARLLDQLVRIPGVRGAVSTEPYQVDFVLERIAFLKLSIARAMLCCGVGQGLRIAASYLSDTRANLREHAYDLLRSFSGQSYKMDAAVWQHWLDHAAPRLTPRPDRSLTDAQKAWGK